MNRFVNDVSAKLRAYVLYRTRNGRETATVATLESMAHVTRVYRVEGEHDLLAIIECADLQSLDATIAKTRRLAGIVNTLPLIASYRSLVSVYCR